MQEKLLVSSSPHIRSDETISRIMWSVVVALAPAALAAVVLFGVSAVAVIVVSIVAAVATEAIIQKLSGQQVISHRVRNRSSKRRIIRTFIQIKIPNTKCQKENA